MGLLQAAYRTYEAYADRAGSLRDGEKEALTPISHIVINAQIEITLSNEGVFQSARAVPKGENKTIVPATIESANRVGDNCRAHPLCDQLRYLAPFGGDKFEAYLSQLEEWAESDYSHPTVRAVFTYIKGGTILRDLADADLIVLDEFGVPGDGKVEGTEYAKCLVRWRVIPDHPSACWQNPSLFDCFARLYAAKCQGEPKDLCMISGQTDMVCEMHPKGVVALSHGAKLVSANDKTGFVYRGRFVDAQQASSVGYIASQKAHSALRWLTVNHGVIWGGRTFLCWNPEGKPVPSLNVLWTSEEEEKSDFISYQNQLKKTLGGYENQLKPEDDVVVAALDAATTGRLSVTYYQELKSSDFLAHIERWYTTCCWDCDFYGIQSPPVRRIVTFAYGTERGDRMDVEDKLLRGHAQRVLSCMIDCRPIPKDLVRALVTKAGNPLGYNHRNRESLLTIACALIRKYRNDDACKADREHHWKENEEEWKLALDTTNNDRSYLFGRWLAVMEQVERNTYDKKEGREPNAIRMQSVFVRRPLYASRIITEQLKPYFEKLHPNTRIRYRRIIEEIVDMLDSKDLELEKSLEDVYLLGYYHQRSALFKKDKALEMEED